MKGVASGSDVQETRYSFDLQLAKGKAPPTFHTFGFERLKAALLPVSAEDAKRMAIKEEQHDPEYESCSGQQQHPEASS